MVRSAPLYVSVETAAVRVVNANGHTIAEKVRTCPDAIRDFLAARARELPRVGLETGPLAAEL